MSAVRLIADEVDPLQTGPRNGFIGNWTSLRRLDRTFHPISGERSAFPRTRIAPAKTS